MPARTPASLDSDPRSRTARGAVGLTSALLTGAGAALVIAGLVAPELTEGIVGSVKVAAQQTASVVTGVRPAVTLAGSGGRQELDAAGRGEFVEMTGYRREGVPPVFAAHNVRGGDVILGWSIGQRVDIHDASTGTTREYVFVEERLTPRWAGVDDLVGMPDGIALQTCIYGSDRMRFVGLVPAATLSSEEHSP